jgi:hypothetical protein
MKCLPVAVLLLLLPQLAFAEPSVHTPKPGSAERQAICDAAREHVLAKYASRSLPQPIVFHIEYIAVQEPYCFFEATPRFKDGSYVPPNDLPDMAYIFCLEKKERRWTVALDLSRSDVPGAQEIIQIKRKLPSNFPITVLSADWRKLLETE